MMPIFYYHYTKLCQNVKYNVRIFICRKVGIKNMGTVNDALLQYGAKIM